MKLMFRLKLNLATQVQFTDRKYNYFLYCIIKLFLTCKLPVGTVKGIVIVPVKAPSILSYNI